MAYYRRYRRRYGRYGRRRYYRRSANGRFKAKIRKSVQQRDMFRVIVSSKPSFESMNFVAKSDSTAGYVTPILIYEPLTTLFGYKITSGNDYARLGSFSNFAKLFDQVKINAVRLKLSVTSIPAPSTNAAITVKQCLDKNGVNSDFASKLVTQIGSSTIGEIESAQAEMESYSSFYSRLVNQTDLYSIYKTFIPSGLQQKGFWYGCSYHPEFANGAARLTSDITTPWKPVFLIQFDTPSLVENGGRTIGFNYQWEFDLTFKGQRQWTEAVSSAAMSSATE